MKVLGLGREKRVGKDTLAAHLQYMRGDTKKIEIMGFADACKAECTMDMLKLFPMAARFECRELSLIGFWRAWCRHKGVPLNSPLEVTFDDPKCPYGKCRQALQWWGTDLRRNLYGEHYWADRMMDRLAEARERGVDCAIITDVRFPNEGDLIKYVHLAGLGSEGRVWELRRIYPEGQEPPRDPHPSERSMDNYQFDLTIYSPTVDQLLAQGLFHFDSFMAWDLSGGLSVGQAVRYNHS